MRRRAINICLALLALTALAVPASAAAKGKKKAKSPTVTRVTPMRARIGGKLTIRGRNFSSKRGRNTVIFRGPDKRTAFAKPRRASSRKLVVVVPSAVARSLGADGSARFKLRVLVKHRFGRWTSKRLSPVLVSSGAHGGGGGPAGASGCGSGDPDGDLLSNDVEQAIGTNPCLKDTDGDGIEDGFEYQSAKDLNNDENEIANTSLPYPGKRPYANALDPSDAGIDFDGDSLTSAEEQQLWLYTIAHGAARTLSPLSYSAGEQYSVYRKVGDNRVPDLPAAGYSKQADFLSWATAAGYRNVSLSDGPPWYSSVTRHQYGLLDANRSGGESPAETTYYDLDQNGYLNDGERDEDADGLTNYDETHGRLVAGYWSTCYSMEAGFPIPYGGTSLVDPDTDGDGIRDGADDQDNDDVPNVMEMSRIAASGLNDTKGRVCTPSDTVGGPNFAGSGGPLPGAAVVVTFRNELNGQNVPQMTADGSGLTGGSSPTVNVATTRDGGGGVDEQQTVTISGGPTGGTFTLTFNGKTTDPIDFDADGPAVESALDALFPAAATSNHPNAYGRVSPFNPCLPATWSRTCPQAVTFTPFAPFDDSVNWLSLQ